MESTAQKVIREIPARFRASAQPILSKLRVCAYARVSTEKEEQEDSFERQVEHYTKHINSKQEWEFSGIYADPGISGTQAENRTDFMRMIADCRAHKIDKVLIKGFSRFARNTVDALVYIRELKELGVSILFENEGIDTLTAGGEVLITILAAQAEQESRNISTNIKWSYQKKFKNGDIQINYTMFLGYTRNKNHELVIVPEEAKTVKRIYREFLSGHSTTQIANGLMEDNVPTPAKKTRWMARGIMSILQNEKYKGDNLTGKTFKPDVLSHKRIKNEGQVTQYYHENSHPAIITKELFDLVQAEIAGRNSLRARSKTGDGKFSSKYPFSTIFYCHKCKARLRRHAHYRNGEMIPKWVCTQHQRSGADCDMPPIKEELVKELYLKVMRELSLESENFKQILTENISSSLDDSTATEIIALGQEIETRQEEMITLNRDKRSGSIRESEYLEKGAKVGEEIDNLQARLTQLQSKTDSTRLAKHRLYDIIKVLDSTTTDEFNEDTFKSLVAKLTLLSHNEIEFELKCGLKVRAKQD